MLIFAGNRREALGWAERAGYRPRDIEYVGSATMLRGRNLKTVPRVFLDGFSWRSDRAEILECLAVADLFAPRTSTAVDDAAKVLADHTLWTAADWRRVIALANGTSLAKLIGDGPATADLS